MQLNLTGHHVDITPALRDYVTSKLEKVERHFDHVTNVHVILSVEKLRQKAEAKIHLTGNEIYADATEENMYSAIDGLIDKLDRQIRKHKEKITDHHRANGALKDQPV
jgi:putative sigma-54 modulation protein